MDFGSRCGAVSPSERLLPVALLACACSSPEPMPPPVESPGIALERLCAELAEADCERLAACGAFYAPFDADLCRQRQAELLCAPTAAALEAAVEAGGLTYFELAARACRSEVEALPCEVGFDHDLLALPACRAMVSPGAAAGEVCHLALACAEGAFCDGAMACPGRCRAFKGNNEPCSGNEPCTEELYCNLTGRRCFARVDLGGACEPSIAGNPCRDGGYCDASQPGQATCRPVRGRGQGCQSSFECIVGARCVANRCSAGVENDTCATSADCVPGLACAQGRCRAPLATDAACAAGGVPCATGLTCTSTRGMELCRPAGLFGELCDADRPCFLGRCAEGTCAPSAADGEACGADADCLPGRTCADSRCTVRPRPCTR